MTLRRPDRRRDRKAAGPLGVLLGLLALLAARASAAVEQGQFEAYVPPEGGAVSAPLFVVIAYAAIWLGVLVFLVSIWRRQRGVTAELKRLRRAQR